MDKTVAALAAVVLTAACGTASTDSPKAAPTATNDALASRPAPRPHRTAPGRPPTAVATPPTSRPPTSVPATAGATLPAGEFWLASHESDLVPGALLRNALVHGDPTTGCIWLVSGGVRKAVLWPKGYRGRMAPTRIYDAGDHLVWQEGVVSDVGGGGSPERVDRLPVACRTGRNAFWVGRVGTP